ncbi:MAG: TIM barrel protein [Candidatus Hydrogenedentes bacterium]|nr:TIM barrel protein [Candidatus Hydrogenedentota bacterium]
MQNRENLSPSRREFLKVSTTTAVASTLIPISSNSQNETSQLPALKGRIKQSVSRWCYSKIPLPEFCSAVKAMGLVGIDLLDPNEWQVVKEHGLVCTMANGPGSIEKGWNDPKNHKQLIENSEKRLREIAQAGWQNMIVFSGNRGKINDNEGLENCVNGLKEIMPLAEELKVNVIMELLNSKRDHKNYMCDHTAWGVELVKRVGSPRLKLLYDIYHMQIMEGDIIQTLTDNIQYIGHIHTGGVPGRGDIDETQELNYRRICEALVELGYQGYVAHEFVPRKPDPLESLKRAVEICDV